MIILEDITNCCGCFTCYNICPTQCISMEQDQEGFYVPRIDNDSCINCKMCRNNCPVLNRNKNDNFPFSYLVRNKNENLRRTSSAGGAFSAIANYVLDKDGIVFGVEFDEEFRVRHSLITNMQDIYKFNRSKYVQSFVGDTFKQAKCFLDSGKYVLYTGTPCQIEGLLNYLGKTYNNLYTMDLVCKGVPSPLVWDRYLEMHRKRNLSGIKAVSFREKTYGYGSATMKVVYNDGLTYNEPYDVDPMLIFYTREMISRKSCYNCKFKGTHRRSDFTVGDYWYVRGVAPQMDDGGGVSQILINTQKGKKLFDYISSNLDIVELDFKKDKAINKGMMVASANPHPQRDNFFVDLMSPSRYSIIDLQKKYAPDTLKLKNKIKRLLRPFLFKTGLLVFVKRYMRRKQFKSKL